MSVFEKYEKKWDSDRLFRSTAERKALYDAYVATRPRVSNITDCVPPARVKGKVQLRRAFDEEQDLWRATDFWREALRLQTSEEKTDFRRRFCNIETLSDIQKQYIDLQDHWLGVKFDGYLVVLYRTAAGGWGMKSRRGVELYPDDAFLAGLAQNTHLPAVMIGELLTGRDDELCAEEHMLDPEQRGQKRNSTFPVLNKIFGRRRTLQSLQELFGKIAEEATFTANDTKALINPNFTETASTITDYLNRPNNVTLKNVTDILQVACGKVVSYMTMTPSSRHKAVLMKILRHYVSYMRWPRESQDNKVLLQIRTPDRQVSGPSPWMNLRVIVFAFPTLCRESDTKRTEPFGMQYMTGLSIMEQSIQLHPHIGVCRFEKFDFKSVAFDYFQSVVKMGLEGLIVVDPHVPYKPDPKLHPKCFFKMKPKTVTKDWIPLSDETDATEWKDGAEVKGSKYTVTIDGKKVDFVDMQMKRNAQNVRIKWMEKCPGAPWPCRAEGYRHMHIASPYDINIPVDTRAPTRDQMERVRYLLGAWRMLFNPLGFESAGWKAQLSYKGHPENGVIPHRTERASAGWQDAYALPDGLFDEPAAGGAPTRGDDAAKPITFEEEDASEAPAPAASRPSTVERDPAQASGSKPARQLPAWARPKPPRELPAWAQPEPPKPARVKSEKPSKPERAKKRKAGEADNGGRAPPPADAPDAPDAPAPVRKNHLASIGRSNASVYTKAQDADAPAADAPAADAPAADAPAADADAEDATARTASDDEAEARHNNLRARSKLSYAPRSKPDGGGPPAPAAETPLTPEQWLAKEMEKEQKEKEAREKNLKDRSGLTYMDDPHIAHKRADISLLLRQLKIYSN